MARRAAKRTRNGKIDRATVVRACRELGTCGDEAAVAGETAEEMWKNAGLDQRAYITRSLIICGYRVNGEQITPGEVLAKATGRFAADDLEIVDAILDAVPKARYPAVAKVLLNGPGVKGDLMEDLQGYEDDDPKPAIKALRAYLGKR